MTGDRKPRACTAASFGPNFKTVEVAVRRSARVLACGSLASVALVVTGGCTDSGPSPTPAPAVTAAPTPQPTTTSVAPEPEPTPTVERSRETAKEFIVDYFADYQEGLRQGSPDPLEGMATPDCGRCAAIAEGLARLAAEGARHPDATITAVPFESRVDEDPTVMLWTVDYRSDVGRKVAGDDVVKTAGPPVRVYFHLELRHDAGRWWMNGMATNMDVSNE